MTELPAEKPMTPAEVADYLRIDRDSVYRLLTSGKLTGYKPTDEWRIFKADILAYLESRRHKARQHGLPVREDRQHQAALASLRARGMKV